MTRWHRHGVTRWWHEVTEKLPGEDRGEWRHLTNSTASCFVPLLLCLSFLLSSFLYLSTSRVLVAPPVTLHHTFELFLLHLDGKCVCGFFVWLSVHVWMCVYMCMRLCANMEVLVYSHMSGVQPYVFVAAFAPVRPLLSHFLLFRFFLVLILFECFTAVGILPVCAHSSESQPWRAQPKGRNTYSCWQLRTTRGRKWKVLPSFHTPAISHTDSATNHDKCASLFVCLCLGTAYICISMRRSTYYTF